MAGARGARSSKKVFLVHGTNHTIRNAIDLFLTKELGLAVCVMMTGVQGGRTLPEKFEHTAGECEFAVFLLTGDEKVQTESGTWQHRARQNVILELGYFWGRLGRKGRIALLVEPAVTSSLPTDIAGLGWIEITADLGETKRLLTKELQDAGIV